MTRASRPRPRPESKSHSRPPSKHRQLRELVMFVIQTSDDFTISDPNGRVPGIILTLCGLTNTRNNRRDMMTVLRQLDKERIVTRRFLAKRRLTCRIEMKKFLPRHRINDIRRRHGAVCERIAQRNKRKIYVVEVLPIFQV